MRLVCLRPKIYRRWCVGKYGIIVEFRTLSNEHGGRNGVESRVILADGERLVVVWSFVALHQSLRRFLYNIYLTQVGSLLA